MVQLLDISGFKPVKVHWEEKLLVWLRKHVDKILGNVWNETDPQVIINGFIKQESRKNHLKKSLKKIIMNLLLRWKSQNNNLNILA